MFPTFTGNARAKRQVNLSGRNNNPFAAYGGLQSSPSVQTSQNAIAHAQQERILRDQERKRPPAAIRIQRTWRGHESRRQVKNQWKQEWDRREGWGTRHLQEGPYATADECLMQLRLLAQFASARSQTDVWRTHHFAKRYSAFLQNVASVPFENAWTYATFRLAKVLIAVLGNHDLTIIGTQTVSKLLSLLNALTMISRQLLVHYSPDYYRSIRNVARYCRDKDALRLAILTLLNPDDSHANSAYVGFTSEILTQAHVPGFSDDLQCLSRHISYSLLASALDETLSPSSPQDLMLSRSHEELLWLLSYFIFFRNESRKDDKAILEQDAQYVKIVSKLISFLASDIEKRIDILHSPIAPDPSTTRDTLLLGSDALPHTEALPDFVRSQILSLISQDNVSGLLTRMGASATLSGRSIIVSEEASALASYALTLLRVFPKRKDDIQMWLYRGSTLTQTDSQRNLPATKYFFQAATSTTIFHKIVKDPRETVGMLQPKSSRTVTSARDQEWRIILLFLEMYTFILRVMDDEEFLAGSSQPTAGASWTKQNALSLDQIATLIVFLKNLAFSMYWNAAEIAGIEVKETSASLAAYFGKEGSRNSNVDTEDSTRADELEIGGISGMTVTSTKDLVTGVLRMLYERE